MAVLYRIRFSTLCQGIFLDDPHILFLERLLLVGGQRGCNGMRQGQQQRQKLYAQGHLFGVQTSLPSLRSLNHCRISTIRVQDNEAMVADSTGVILILPQAED
jgi:hypothetical protein